MSETSNVWSALADRIRTEVEREGPHEYWPYRVLRQYQRRWDAMQDPSTFSPSDVVGMFYDIRRLVEEIRWLREELERVK